MLFSTQTQPDEVDNTLSCHMTFRLTKNSAERLRSEAARLGFATTGEYVREIVESALTEEPASSVILETLLRVELFVAECFKLASPEEEQGTIDQLREASEARSQHLLQAFLLRRDRLVNKAAI